MHSMKDVGGGSNGTSPTDPQDPHATRSATFSTAHGASDSVRADIRPSHPLPSRDPDRYDFLGEHGRGGIGRVAKARDRDLDRVLAVKELVASDPLAEARFVREILLTASLEHPGIVPVHDAGRWATDGRSFYTMKMVAGASLRDVVERAKTLEQRLALTPHVLAVCEAVAYAHSRGIIHRDLKPSNVIVGEYGETIVIDWGLAKRIGDVEPSEPRISATDSLDDLTVVGSVVGTPAFMAPEQARGAPVDARADVYALGAMAYYVLTGKTPYDGPSGADVIRQLAGDAAPLTLRVREPRVPVDLAAIVEKAMARSPDDRYPSARELAGDLRRYQAGRFVQARDYAWWEPITRWLRRHWLGAALTALFAALAVTGAVIAFEREQALRRVAEAERGRAEGQTLALLEEQGRRELDAGRPHRAAVLLAEALRRKPDSRGLRSLLSQAVRPTEAHLRTLRGPERDVVCLAFSPDGTQLVSGSSDHLVRIWDVATGAERVILRGHEKSLEDVAWSPDGALIASLDDGASTRIWRATDGGVVRTLIGGGFRLAFSPDGTQLWVGRKSGALKVWAIADGRLLLDAKPHTDRVSSIVFDGKGRAFTTSWDGRLIVWDAATLTAQRTIDDQQSSLQFAQVGDGLLMTGDEEGTVNVRNADTMAVLHSFRMAAASHATSGWFRGDGRSVLTVSADGAIRVWHATSGQALLTVDAVPEGKLFDGAVSRDGVVATASLRTIDLWRPDAAADFRIFAGGDYAQGYYAPGELTADGTRFILPRRPRDGAPEIGVWDTATGERVARWAETGLLNALAVTRDGRRVVVADYDTQAPRIRDGASGALLGQLSGHSRLVYGLAISPDDQRIATASYDRTVRQWKLADGAAVGPTLTFDQRTTAVAFDPTGPRLAVALENGVVELYDRERGSKLRSWQAHATWIEDVEFSRDGRYLVSAGRQDHTVKIWELGRDAPPVVLTGHKDNVARATFSPDGSQVATCSMDDTARLWDARSGELLRTLPGPTETCAFAPDGRTLFTAGLRDYAVAWRLDPDPRPADALAAAVEAASPWRLDQGRLVLRQPAP